MDLFSGGGGLTQGLKAAGFRVCSAVELDVVAADTYRANHRKTRIYVEDLRNVRGEDLLQDAEGHIDLLAACPPCQGFCTLTNKYRRPDPRNELIIEVGRLVEEILPTAIMIENVPGLAQKGMPLLKIFLQKIQSLGYHWNFEVLQAADYGVPQFRRRFVLMAGRGFEIPIPRRTHSRNGEEKNTKPWKDLRSAIGGFGEPVTTPQAALAGGPRVVDWHVVRAISEKNLARLKAALPGKSWKEIPEDVRPQCHRGGYEGFPNVYGRMTWDDPSPTITAGCLTPSMGRFGHPESDRTISLREAAVLQTFPPSYVFATDFVEKAVRIVGNAFPCEMARLLGRSARNEIRRHIRRDVPESSVKTV